MGKINYKYDEGNILSELKEYIDSTYDEHYSKNKFQATEFIIMGAMVKVSVLETYSSMHKDMEKRMVRTEMTC